MRDQKNEAEIGRPKSFHLLCALVCGVVPVAPLLGCGDPSGQFFIVHNQVPTAGCVIPADKSASYQGEGVLDVRVPSVRSDAAYLLFPLLQNDLPADDTDGASSANRIALTGFEVDLTAVSGPDAFQSFFSAAAADPTQASLVKYQVPWSGSVDAGGGNTSATTNVFPVETAQRLRDSGALANGAIGIVNAHVRATGRTLAKSVRSDAFTYPIQVCDGCLIRRTSACPLTAPVLTGGVCNPGQDGPVDCCTNGSALICPATAAP